MIARPIKSGRTKLGVLAAAAMVALTGCGALNPGVAAVVGSSTIPHDTVDDLASALCTVGIQGAEAEGRDSSNLPAKERRQLALQILLETELSKTFGQAEGVDPNQQMVSQALAQGEQFIEALPESQQAGVREASKALAEGELILAEIGMQSLEDQGQTEVTQDQATAEGQRLRGEFVKTIDVEIDPRYGTFEQNTLRPGGTALSVAASDFALAGDEATSAPGYVSGLPASQRCS